MRYTVGLALFAGLLAQSAVRAEDALENDLSRGQLFAKYILSQTTGGAQILSLDRDFIFPDDMELLKKSGQPFLIGVDVSHHNTDGCNCKIDWSVVYDSGARYVYAKASQGTGFFDKSLPVNWKGISDNPASKKLYKGAFHFLSADGSGEDQGNFFVSNLDKQLASIGSKRQEDDLPPVVDLEWDHRVAKGGKPAPCSDGKIHKDCWELVAPDEILSRLSAWLKTVANKTGRVPLVYTARSWVKERIKDEGKFAAVVKEIWDADYLKHDKTGKNTILTVGPAVPKGVKVRFWQYSDRAQMPDPSNLDGVDSNIFKGSIDEFKTAFQLPK
jgi:lysozyme